MQVAAAVQGGGMSGVCCTAIGVAQCVVPTGTGMKVARARRGRRHEFAEGHGRRKEVARSRCATPGTVAGAAPGNTCSTGRWGGECRIRASGGLSRAMAKVCCGRKPASVQSRRSRAGGSGAARKWCQRVLGTGVHPMPAGWGVGTVLGDSEAVMKARLGSVARQRQGHIAEACEGVWLLLLLRLSHSHHARAARV